MDNAPGIVTSMPKRLESPKFWVEHIPFVFYLVPKLKPSVIVELGTHSGNSFFAFCQAAKENNIAVKCYAVDTWRGDKHSGPYPEAIYTDVLKHKNEHYKDSAILLRMTFDEARNIFPDKSIDLLNIDGLHTYEAIQHDFENWLPKISDHGLVLIHDTRIKIRDFGVWKFWENISKQYPSFEFHYGCGLGILAIGNNVPQSILQFIQDASSSNHYSEVFKTQGEIVYKEYKKLQTRRNIKNLPTLPLAIINRLKMMFR
jgi:hypothetical protein